MNTKFTQWRHFSAMLICLLLSGPVSSKADLPIHCRMLFSSEDRSLTILQLLTLKTWFDSALHVDDALEIIRQWSNKEISASEFREQITSNEIIFLTVIKTALLSDPLWKALVLEIFASGEANALNLFALSATDRIHILNQLLYASYQRGEDTPNLFFRILVDSLTTSSLDTRSKALLVFSLVFGREIGVEDLTETFQNFDSLPFRAAAGKTLKGDEAAEFWNLVEARHPRENVNDLANRYPGVSLDRHPRGEAYVPGLMEIYAGTLVSSAQVRASVLQYVRGTTHSLERNSHDDIPYYDIFINRLEQFKLENIDEARLYAHELATAIVSGTTRLNADLEYFLQAGFVSDELRRPIVEAIIRKLDELNWPISEHAFSLAKDKIRRGKFDQYTANTLNTLFSVAEKNGTGDLYGNVKYPANPMLGSGFLGWIRRQIR